MLQGMIKFHTKCFPPNVNESYVHLFSLLKLADVADYISVLYTCREELIIILKLHRFKHYLVDTNMP